MSKDDLIELSGEIIQVYAGGWFDVKIGELDDHVVKAYIGGKIRKNKIRIMLGDGVTVAVSPYDPHKGKIIYRH